MRVEQVIRRVNRDVMLTWGIHAALGVGVVMALSVGLTTEMPVLLLAMVPCTLWVLLAVNGMRETRNAMNWPTLIAAGQLDEAEKQIEQTIRGFSLLRSIKLLCLHQLAVLRMAQRNWKDAAQLSSALLRMRVGRDRSLTRASLMVLAGAAVKLGDLPTAFDAIGRLRGLELSLDEQLGLLAAESAYLARLESWGELLQNVDQKARLAELMPAEVAAQTQAYLLLGAMHHGRSDWEAYLKGRCELLCPVRKLVAEEPLFRKIWSMAG